jgi:hypothetical protein
MRNLKLNRSAEVLSQSWPSSFRTKFMVDLIDGQFYQMATGGGDRSRMAYDDRPLTRSQMQSI